MKWSAEAIIDGLTVGMLTGMVWDGRWQGWVFIACWAFISTAAEIFDICRERIAKA